MKKISLLLFVLFICISCDPFSDYQKKGIEVNNKTIYFLSKEWGINTGKHFKVVISKDTKFDNDDINLGEMFDVLYSVENKKLIIHTYKKIKINKTLESTVVIKRYENIDYLNLLDRVKSKQINNIMLYQPFEN